MAPVADQSLLLQPFLAKPATRDSDSGIFLRIFTMILVGSISLWANHEASKGFSITIINEAKETPSGKRFSLLFESDDTAVRVLLETSFSVERLLYDGVPHRLRKPVNHVTVRFYDGVDKFTVTCNASHGEYVISLSSSLVGISEFRNDVRAALRRSMVRVWLWGDDWPELVDGLVEYLVAVEKGGERRRFDEIGVYHPKDKESVSVARWLDYCERRSEGFIRRLNHGMRLGWDDDQTGDLASSGACGSRKGVLREPKDEERQWI